MAGYTIDIDTGGTFTDCFLHRDGEVRMVKVPTTPHDLTVCFLESIKAGAAAFGLGPEDLLYETDITRFSSTIGTNTIIQRDGAGTRGRAPRTPALRPAVRGVHGRMAPAAAARASAGPLRRVARPRRKDICRS